MEIQSAQKKYKIAFHRKMEHLLVLMDHSSFTSLNGKITHSVIAIISRKLNSAKINIEKFNQQISFRVEPGYTANIKPTGDCGISECKLPMQFDLPCKCWLYQGVIDQFLIPISLIHPPWFYKGPLFVVFWKMNFDLDITVDKMLVLALQKKETLVEDADFVIEEDINWLDSPPQKIA